MIIHKCDNCGIQVEQKKGERWHIPTGWFPLSCGGHSNTYCFEICSRCRVALGIPESDCEARKDAAERLIELLTEIVQEEVEAHIE